MERTRTKLGTLATTALVGGLAVGGCSSGGGSYYSTGDGGASLGDGGAPKAGPSSNGKSTDSGLTIIASSAYTTDVLVTHGGTSPSAGFPKRGNIFLVVTVQLRNESFPDPLPTRSSHFALKTDEGVVYRAWLPTDRIDGSCAGRGEVAEGGTSKPCKIAFEYPESETPVAVTYAASTSTSGRAEVEVPEAEAGPAGFCDRVSHSTGTVSASCNNCIQTKCAIASMPFEPGVESQINLPDGTCPSAPYCICEREAYEKLGRGSFYEMFEGCVGTRCAAECVAN